MGLSDDITVAMAVFREVLFVVLVGRASLAWGGRLKPDGSLSVARSIVEIEALKKRGLWWLAIGWPLLLNGLLNVFGARVPGSHPELTFAGDVMSTIAIGILVVYGLNSLRSRGSASASS